METSKIPVFHFLFLIAESVTLNRSVGTNKNGTTFRFYNFANNSLVLNSQ